jgi:hypothetical protein
MKNRGRNDATINDSSIQIKMYLKKYFTEEMKYNHPVKTIFFSTQTFIYLCDPIKQTERCQSEGLLWRKFVYAQVYRGFESLSLR